MVPFRPPLTGEVLVVEQTEEHEKWPERELSDGDGELHIRDDVQRRPRERRRRPRDAERQVLMQRVPSVLHHVAGDGGPARATACINGRKVSEAVREALHQHEENLRCSACVIVGQHHVPRAASRRGVRLRPRSPCFVALDLLSLTRSTHVLNYFWRCVGTPPVKKLNARAGRRHAAHRAIDHRAYGGRRSCISRTS